MLPQTWISKLAKKGGFALIFKYQLFPRSMKLMVEKIKETLGLPVGCPRRLEDGTMKRVIVWHDKNVNSKKDSHPI